MAAMTLALDPHEMQVNLPCQGMSWRGFETLLRLLPCAKNLRRWACGWTVQTARDLDLTGVAIGMRGPTYMHESAQARADAALRCDGEASAPHVTRLNASEKRWARDLRLMRVGLGGHMLTSECLHKILGRGFRAALELGSGSQSCKKLDLSWNVFNKQDTLHFTGLLKLF